MAVTKDKKNIFVIRGKILEDPAEWWRPGMSGISNINIGDKNILWIFTHRTIDFLRILFWW